MFDNVEIRVKAGDGGKGSVSFRREKFIPLGGPDGGDGGKGGDVTIRADAGVTNLKIFLWQGLYKAKNGLDGGKRKKHGKNGDSKELLVPVGTIILETTEDGDNLVIADLSELGQRVVVVKGGKGGLGNVHFASSTNQTPRIAQKGESGEEKVITLELRIIADVGIIGYPNVGKSSLLAAATAAKPKIASYPFTTLEPIPGVVVVGNHSFVLAEIPGLIEGASLGRGLGHDFLRHVVRTRVLIHLLDGSSELPVEDMIQVNNELSIFDAALAKKPQLVAVNKIDLPDVRMRMKDIKESLSNAGVTPHFVSASNSEGVAGLMEEVMEALGEAAPPERLSNEAVSGKVFTPKPITDGVYVYQEDDVFVVSAPGLERIISGTNANDIEARRQIMGRLTRPAISHALKKAGVKVGDKVRCGSFEWRW